MNLKQTDHVFWALLSLVSGVITILFSTSYQSQFEHWALIFPWQFPWWVLLPFFLTGLFMFFSIISSSRMLWFILIFMAVTTSGVFVLRFPIFDDWLMGWAALGAQTLVLAGKVKRRNLIKQKFWISVFLLFMLHLLILGIAGLYLYENLKTVRFILLFSSIAIFAWLNIFYDFPSPSASEILKLIALAGTFFCVLYLAHGLIFYKSVRTIILEGIGFATSGYQTAPFIVIVPTAVVLFNMCNQKLRLWGIIILILTAAVTVLTDSRGGILAFLVSAIFMLIAFGFSRAIKTLMILFLSMFIIGIFVSGHAGWVGDILESSIKGIRPQKGTHVLNYFGRKVSTAKGDSGRYLYIKTGFYFLRESFPFPALTGAGIYGYFPAAQKYLNKASHDSEIDPRTVNYAASLQKSKKEPSRPPAAGALLVETGIIGILLACSCVFMTFGFLIFRKTSERKVILLRGPRMMMAASIVIFLGFTYFSELQDIVLGYIMFMPYGLMHRLVENTSEVTCSSG